MEEYLARSNDTLVDEKWVYGQVYCITNTLNGKQYVGQTSSHRFDKKYRPFGYLRRFREHILHARHDSTRDYAILRAIRKYGEPSFQVELLENCPKEVLNDREQFYVKKLNTISPNGYNLTAGGEQEKSMAPEIRRRNSQKMKAFFESEDGQQLRSKLSSKALAEWHERKFAKFRGVPTINISELDTYMKVTSSKNVNICTVYNQCGPRKQAQQVRFTSKFETKDQVIERARQFLLEVYNRQQQGLLN